MFEPKTHWEKRAAMTEALVLQLCNATGLTGLLGPWQQQLSVLKSVHVDQTLGPVTLEPEFAADGQFMFDTLPAMLTAAGLIASDETDAAKVDARIASLPNLDEAMGPEIVFGLYQITAADQSRSPAIVIRQGDLVNIIVLDEEGLHPLSLSLAHMPSTFEWGTQNPMFWRSEIFTYRNTIEREILVADVETILANLDFTAVDAEIAAAEAATATDAANDDVVAEVVEPVVEVAPVAEADTNEA